MDRWMDAPDPRWCHAEVVSYQTCAQHWWLRQIQTQQEAVGSRCFQHAILRPPGHRDCEEDHAEVLWDDDAGAGWMTTRDDSAECVVADSLTDCLGEMFTLVWS